jgi:hypothetical protein
MSEQTEDGDIDRAREEQAIRQKLRKKFSWSDESITLGLDATFKCEYCGKYLLTDVEAFKQWTTDHIVPKSKQGPEAQHNWALACRTCNLVKRDFNPSEGQTSNRREDLIKRSWEEYIRGRRDNLTQALEEQKALLERLSSFERVRLRGPAWAEGEVTARRLLGQATYLRFTLFALAGSGAGGTDRTGSSSFGTSSGRASVGAVRVHADLGGSMRSSPSSPIRIAEWGARRPSRSMIRAARATFCVGVQVEPLALWLPDARLRW